MKKTEYNKIDKVIKEEGADIKYCTATNKLFYNGNPITKKALMIYGLFDKARKKLGTDDNDTYILLCQYAVETNSFDSIKEKQAAKQAEKDKKDAEKQAELQAKQAEKDRKTAEKQAELEAKQAEKEAERAAKQAEKDRKDAEKEAERAAKQAEREAKQAEREAKQAELEDMIRKRKDLSTKDDWYKYIELNPETGYPKPTKQNAANFFRYCEKYGKNLRYDTFSETETWGYQLIEPYHITHMDIDMEKAISQTNEQRVQQVTSLVCHENKFNAVIEKLESLPKWDGVKRKDRFFIDYIGADDTALNEHMTCKWFFGMMKRIFMPGCNFDHMLITYDETHGTGKTSSIIELVKALEMPCNNDGVVFINDISSDKDTVQTLNRAFVAVCDELAKLLKTDEETIKKFITQTKDNVRLAYGKNNKTFLRRCVIYGSTNTRRFIKDCTDDYERRFWILDCHGTKHEDKKYWDKKLPLDVKKQILAEIYQFYLENPYYDYNTLDADDTRELIKIQRGHRTVNADDTLALDLEIIFNLRYDDPYAFNSYYDWHMETLKKWQKIKENGYKNYEFSEDFMADFNRIMGENQEKTGQKMAKIPVIWVKKFIQEEMRRSVSNDDYIKQMVGLFTYSSFKLDARCTYNGVRGCFLNRDMVP